MNDHDRDRIEAGEPDLTLLLAQSAKAVVADPIEAKSRFHAVVVAALPPKREACSACGKRHRSITALECQDRAMSEHTLNERVRYRANRRGWKVAHAAKVETPQGWRTAMAKGWPDLFLMRESDGRVLAIELKKELEAPDEDQLVWLRLLIRCGIPAVVVRPSDLREGRVNAILR